MPSKYSRAFSLVFCVLLLPLLTTAQYSSTGSNGSAAAAATAAASERRNRATIAHAVLAVLAWSFFVPLGALVLRFNIQSPVLLRIHIVCQLFSYIGYIAAAALGIWLANQEKRYGVWDDPHPAIGLMLLILSFAQPWLGWVHHRIFKRRFDDTTQGREGPKPGRTILSRIHVWNGRVLIILAIINGGLGIRLGGKNPSQPASVTRRAEIAYGVLSVLVFLLYVGVTAIFEHRRDQRIRQDHTSSGHSMKDRMSGSSSEGPV